ncbi:MAG TPA: hypothetical protein VFW00_07165 [Rhodocyclaceae bacterium]|nr:hypothetical protein [Rhodocyclaceae bacterium]
MRISADSKSADWHPISCHVKVFLDGVEQRGVTMADEECGQVVKYAQDSAGKFVFNRELDSLMSECLHGTVKIEVPDDKNHLLTEFPFGPMESHDVTVGELEPVNLA